MSQKKLEEKRLKRAEGSLLGLSVGDALGERYFKPPEMLVPLLERRALPQPPWEFTDDTMMALSLFSVLRQYGTIDQDALARSFAEHYHPHRGYGRAMHVMLPQIRYGAPWRPLASGLFEGKGSFGNGSAMRVAPLGAYFADDPEQAAHQARLSAEVTHTHPEAIAGAIAVAVAAALWGHHPPQTPPPAPPSFLGQVLDFVPPSQTRDGIALAREQATSLSVAQATELLGNGSAISAQDTVPFTLWCASQHLDQFEEAFWLTVSGLGDRDTTCAIVGGIVASGSPDSIPPEWLNAREPLPDWPFQE